MSSFTPANSHHGQVVEIARKLAQYGKLVDVHGAAGHIQGLPTIAFTLAITATFAMIALVWPFFGLAGIIAVIGSALRDLDGGQGWLRRLLIRDVSHTIVAWPDDCIPGEHYSTRPTLLITSPLEDDLGPTSIGNKTVVMALGCMLLTAITVAASTWTGPYPAIFASALLALGSIAVWIKDRLQGDKSRGNPARDVLLRTMEQAHSAKNIRIIWALVGGGAVHHDGLGAFLLDHKEHLPSDNTRVLALHPSKGPCSWVDVEGRVRTIETDGLLGEIASKSNIPRRQATTAARKAQQLGWRATGICVSDDQIHLGTKVVCTIIDTCDTLAGEDAW